MDKWIWNIRDTYALHIKAKTFVTHSFCFTKVNKEIEKLNTNNNNNNSDTDSATPYESNSPNENFIFNIGSHLFQSDYHNLKYNFSSYNNQTNNNNNKNISTPKTSESSPNSSSSPEYNPKSDYFKYPSISSPMHNDNDNNNNIFYNNKSSINLLRDNDFLKSNFSLKNKSPINTISNNYIIIHHFPNFCQNNLFPKNICKNIYPFDLKNNNNDEDDEEEEEDDDDDMKNKERDNE